MKNTKYLDVTEILPHKPPMVLIDRVLEYNLEQRSLLAEIDITPDSPFFDQTLGGVPACFGLEYMAQTVGTFSGIVDKESNLEAIEFGFILGTRKYENHIDLFSLAKYYVNIAEIFNGDELTCFAAEVKNDTGEVVAAAELNLFKPRNPAEFLEKD